MLTQRFTSLTWTDGEEFTFNVSEADKEGLNQGDYVVLITGINSVENNTRVYGTVTRKSQSGKLSIYIEWTVIE